MSLKTSPYFHDICCYYATCELSGFLKKNKTPVRHIGKIYHFIARYPFRRENITRIITACYWLVRFYQTGVKIAKHYDSAR